MLNHPWFTVQRIDEQTFAISEYGHWEKVHSFLLLGQQKAALIDTGLGISNISEVTRRLTPLPVSVLTPMSTPTISGVTGCSAIVMYMRGIAAGLWMAYRAYLLNRLEQIWCGI